MGGKSGASNNQMVQFEMQQAAEAKQKEADRQARLASGTQAVNDIFSAGNFDDSFYNKFNTAQLNYYQPQVDTQYNQAKEKLATDLARSGMLNSSTAGYNQGLIKNQYDTATAGVGAQADTATAGLRTNILNEKQQALNQLYATEDPSIAANQATSAVQQAAIAKPNLNPLGALFTPIAVGGSQYASSALDNYYINRGLAAADPNRSSSAIIGS
jgi:hypothetical protein